MSEYRMGGAITAVALGLALLAAPGPANAGVIVGGSALLTSGYELQLESWLGEGSLTLTNIYTMANGDTGPTFHAAVDGKGRTFSVMQITQDGITAIVGGYDPRSWSSIGDYNITVPDAQRTAFIFNLSDGILYPQLLSAGINGPVGQYQTINYNLYGPGFGGGHDLVVGDFISNTGCFCNGYSYLISYSALDSSNVGISVVTGTAPINFFFDSVDAIETFTIASDTAVPEPLTISLFGAGAVGLAAMRRRKKAKLA